MVEVMGLMSRHSISGIPIIDDAGHLIDIYTVFFSSLSLSSLELSDTHVYES